MFEGRTLVCQSRSQSGVRVSAGISTAGHQPFPARPRSGKSPLSSMRAFIRSSSFPSGRRDNSTRTRPAQSPHRVVPRAQIQPLIPARARYSFWNPYKRLSSRNVARCGIVAPSLRIQHGPEAAFPVVSTNSWMRPAAICPLLMRILFRTHGGDDRSMTCCSMKSGECEATTTAPRRGSNTATAPAGEPCSL